MRWRSLAAILSGWRPEDTWEHYGRTDPYYGVITDEKFRLARLDPAARAEFFASGERHVEQLLAIVRAEVDPAFSPRRALDFGCGVGRVVVPLARRCSEVVGVDVSEGMLEEARRNCDEQGVRNAALVLSDDRLSRVRGRFDFLHSFIVFQHMPSRRAERVLAAMLDVLEEGGVGALHFTYSRRVSRARRALQRVRAGVPGVHAAANLLRGRPASEPHIQMNAHDLSRVFALLQDAGCHRVHTRFTDHGGHRGAVLFFQKRALPSI